MWTFSFQILSSLITFVCSYTISPKCNSHFSFNLNKLSIVHFPKQTSNSKFKFYKFSISSFTQSLILQPICKLHLHGNLDVHFKIVLVISRYYHIVRYWQILSKNLQGMTVKNLLMMVVTLMNKRWLREGRWWIKVFENLSNGDLAISWHDLLKKY